MSRSLLPAAERFPVFNAPFQVFLLLQLSCNSLRNLLFGRFLVEVYPNPVEIFYGDKTLMLDLKRGKSKLVAAALERDKCGFEKKQ